MHQGLETNQDSTVLSFGGETKKGTPLITFGFDANGQLAIKIHDHAIDDPEALSSTMFYLTQKPEVVDRKLLQAVQNACIKDPTKLSQVTEVLTRLKTLIALDSVEKPTMSGFDAFVG